MKFRLVRLLLPILYILTVVSFFAPETHAAASLLYDSFDKTTIDASKWTIVNNSGMMALNNGQGTPIGALLFNVNAGSYGSGIYSKNTFARSGGRTLLALLRSTLGNSEGPVIHFSPTSFPASPRTTGYGTYIDNASSSSSNEHPRAVVPGAEISYNATRAYDRDYLVATVLRPTGSYHLISGGAFGTFPTATLFWVNDHGTDDPMYAGFNASNGISQFVNSTRVTDFTGNFATQNGLATSVDTFTRADSTNLGNTETGNFAWTENSGDAQIQNNAVTRAGSDEVVSTIDTGSADGIFEMTFTTPSAPFADPALYFRYTDGNNWYRFHCDSSSVILEKNDAGNFSQVYQTGIACAPNSTIRLVIRAHGSNIGLFLNDSDITQAGGITDSSSLTGTKVGFGIWPDGFGTSPTIDNFYVWPKTVTLPTDAIAFPTQPTNGVTTLISDTFTASNGTSLSSHSPNTNTPGGSWSENRGSWTINSNAVAPAAVDSFATIDTGQTNVSASVDISVGNQSEWFNGLVGRYVDDNNKMIARFLWQSNSPEIEFWDTVAGSTTGFCATSLVGDLSQNTTYNMKMAVVGNKVAIYLDNLLVLECTTANLTGTRFGLMVDTGGSVNTYDNFVVKTALADAVAAPEVTDLATSTPSTDKPLMTWSTVYDDASGTSFYRIYRSTSSGALGSQINSDGITSTGSYTDNSLSSFGTYYYTAHSVDIAGNENMTEDNNQLAFNYNSSGGSSSGGGSSGGGSSSGGSNGPPSCSSTTPTEIPDLFQVEAAGNYATLHFTTAKNSVSGYSISYGLTPSANQYSDNFAYTGPLWVIERTINNLTPKTTYYFKIRTVNGCTASDWGKTITVKTPGRLSGIAKIFTRLISSTNSNSGNPAAPLSNVCTYTVQSSDSLWGIAVRKWGQGKKYTEIITMNPALTHSTIIHKGQQLALCP